MLHFALNHMTVPSRPVADVVDLAASLGCAGVELRNDLGRPMFDGMSAAQAGTRVRGAGLRVLGLSQVYPFNRWSDEIELEIDESATELIEHILTHH